MLFNSYVFVFLMLPFSIVGYYLINKRNVQAGSVFLLICSFVFIGYLNPMFLVMLIPSIAVNYFIGYTMNRSGVTEGLRKLLLTSGIVIDVAVLAFFKYSNFFIDNVNSILSKDIASLKLILPLGISFYTFQQLSCGLLQGP